MFYSTHGTTRILRQMQAPTLFEKQNWETSCIHSWSLQHTDTRRTTKSRHEPAQMGRESAKTRSRHVRTSQDLLSMLKTCSYKSRPACSGPDSLPGVAPLCLQVLMQMCVCPNLIWKSNTGALDHMQYQRIKVMWIKMYKNMSAKDETFPSRLS